MFDNSLSFFPILPYYWACLILGNDQQIGGIMKTTNYSTILLGILALSIASCGKKQTPSSAGSANDANNTSSNQESPITGPTDGSSLGASQNLRDLPAIYFDYDQSTLNEESRKTLQTIAPELKNTTGKLNIEGHTDERGSNEYNLALGESRAKAVRDYLKKLGITSDKLSVASYGEEKPANVEKGESSWAKNRRAELNLNK